MRFYIHRSKREVAIVADLWKRPTGPGWKEISLLDFRAVNPGARSDVVELYARRHGYAGVRF